MRKPKRRLVKVSPVAALGYARVSTDEQARHGVSLDVQRERIAAYAVAKGLELADILADGGCRVRTSRDPPSKNSSAAARPATYLTSLYGSSTASPGELATF